MDIALADTFKRIFGFLPAHKMADWEVALCIVTVWKPDKIIYPCVADLTLAKIIVEVEYPTDCSQEIVTNLAKIYLRDYCPVVNKAEVHPAVVAAFLKKRYEELSE